MSRDLRRYTRETNIRLLAGFLLLLFLVGGGLIYLFFGLEAALLGVVCLVLGLLPLLIIWLLLSALDWLLKRGER